ncbi:MAG: CRISPR-associated CARF protein Csx1 [Candidatus Asgardarchaeia archaeon]
MMLIATWGNPMQWDEVTYVYDGNEVISSTSVKPLQDLLKLKRVLIIGLDTVAFKESDYNEVLNNYDEVLTKAERYLSKYASKFGIRGFEILVAPGKGTFSNGVFNGNMMDYYYYILVKLSKCFIKYFKNKDIIEVHLDLTHGINFMPVLTYRALKQILAIISMFKPVKLKVYNADPRIKGYRGRLLINLVEDCEVSPIPFDRKILSKHDILVARNLSDEQKRDLFKNKLAILSVVDKKSKELSAFLGAIRNGLPLALYRFFPEDIEFETIIDVIINVYKDYIEVKKENSQLKVERALEFGKNFETFLIVYLYTSLLKYKFNFKRKYIVEISELKKLCNEFFKYDERLHSLISNELNYEINKIDYNKLQDGSWHLYDEIIYDKPSKRQPHERNFLAHAGFDRTLVELKKENDKLLFRYCEKKIRNVKKFSTKGLKDDKR